ncbi:MAG: hypothetical protein IJA79_01545 [Desulfovibrio sp.]|nr:hypothetical protein [Desulfovibrio sp.]
MQKLINLFKIFIIIFTLSVNLGCAPKISLIPEKYYSEEGAAKVLIAGKTTESDVRKIYGSPDYIYGDSSYLTTSYTIYPNPFSRDRIEISCIFINNILNKHIWKYIRP